MRQLLAADGEWVKPFGNLETDTANEVTVDSADNVYVVARFAGEVDLDPDASYVDNRDLLSVPLTASGVVVAKFDAEGQLLWSHVAEGQDSSLAGSQSSTPHDIQVHNDAVYVQGSLNDLWDFDPSNGGTDSQLNQYGSGAGSYLLKLDATSGEFQWVTGFGLSDAAVSDDDSLAVAPNGTAYLSISLREGAQIGNVIVPAQPTSYAKAIVSVADDGTVLGFEELIPTSMMSTPTLEFVTPNADPASWRLYLSAGFQGELLLNGNSIASSVDARDVFLASLTTDFQIDHVSTYAYPLNQYTTYLASNGTDIYLAGDLGIDIADNTGSSLIGDDFVFRADLDGNLLATQSFGGDTSNATIWSLVAKEEGVLLGGYFYDTVDFGGEALTSLNGTSDGFVALLDTDLSAVVARQYDGTDIDRVRDVAVNSAGLVAIVGSFRESANIPVAGGISSAGGDDGYIAVVDLNENSGGNLAPVALDDQYTFPNREVQVGAENGLLNNDLDPDGDSVYIELLTQPSDGSLQLNQDGSFTFTPNPGFLGTDQFTYRISDAELASEPATVTLDVLEEAVLFEDSFEEGMWNGKWVGDGYGVWFQSSQRSTDGNFSAEADGFAFSDSLTVAGAFDLSNVTEATFSFDWLIESGFDTGEYLRVEFFDGEDWTTAPAGYIRGNDDPENTWIAREFELSSKYLVDGFRFRFTATVSNHREDANVDNVRLIGLVKNDSNLPPEANDDAAATAEDQAITIDVLANDSDPEGDALTILSVTQPASGIATVASGLVQYVPDANFNGNDSFAYTIIDTAGNQASATVNVTINPVNDAPIASGDSYSLDQDTTLNIGVPGLLGNDFDVDADVMTSILVTGPTSGSLTLNTEGSFSYTPSAGFVGSDSFTYHAVDTSAATSNLSTVDLQVNAVATGPKLSHGVVGTVTSVWQTVSLSNTYNSAVIVATPRYNNNSGPGVVRISNVTSSTFDVRVDNVGASTFDGGIHFIAMEEGVYDVPGAYKLEAVKVNASATSRRSGWQINTESYAQSYSNPVVVGQVMSANDDDWSVFWSSSSSRTSPANSGSLNIGKHIAEDSDTTRATETLGYFVIESTNGGTLDGFNFSAGVGGDVIRGVGNGTYQYSNVSPSGATTAVLSSAGMDGNDGGWAVLMGDNPLASDNINLAIDEDQIGDSERNHTTEQVAYFVIGGLEGEGEAGLQAAPGITVHDPLDVNGDGFTSPIDALQVINRLNSNSVNSSSRVEEGDWALDTNGDGQISPLDALLVINHLNAISAEGEASPVQAQQFFGFDSYFCNLEDDEEGFPFWGEGWL